MIGVIILGVMSGQTGHASPSSSSKPSTSSKAAAAGSSGAGRRGSNTCYDEEVADIAAGAGFYSAENSGNDDDEPGNAYGSGATGRMDRYGAHSSNLVSSRDLWLVYSITGVGDGG